MTGPCSGMCSLPLIVGFHSTRTTAITNGLAISYSTEDSWVGARSSTVGDEPGGRGCDDGPMAFSELSHPWRARGHSNPRGGLLLCHGFTGSPDRKSTRLNSSHVSISYAVFCFKK